MPEALSSAEAVTDQDVSPTSCYRCGAELDLSTPDVCSICGRRQTRVCICGAEISRGLEVCPHCGTEWSHIRKRSHRSGGDQRKGKLLKYSAIGGGVALGLAIIGMIVQQYLTNVSVDQAGQVVQSSWAAFASLVANAARLVGLPLAALVVGAAGGALVHYIGQQRRRARRSGRRLVKRRRRDGV